MSTNPPATPPLPTDDVAHGPSALEDAEWLQDLRDDLRWAATKPEPPEPVTSARSWWQRLRPAERADRS